jgi:hypothetical protein
MNTPYTGERCGCKRGIERDNCPQCEGSGKRVDFARIHRERAERERLAREMANDRLSVAVKR